MRSNTFARQPIGDDRGINPNFPRAFDPFQSKPSKNMQQGGFDFEGPGDLQDQQEEFFESDEESEEKKK